MWSWRIKSHITNEIHFEEFNHFNKRDNTFYLWQSPLLSAIFLSDTGLSDWQAFLKLNSPIILWGESYFHSSVALKVNFESKIWLYRTEVNPFVQMSQIVWPIKLLCSFVASNSVSSENLAKWWSISSLIFCGFPVYPPPKYNVNSFSGKTDPHSILPLTFLWSQEACL